KIKKQKEEEKRKQEEEKKKKEKTELKKRQKEERKKKEGKKKKEQTKVNIVEKLKIRRASIKGNRFLRDFFRATRYLLLGVDISDHSIEVLLLDRDGAISSYGRSVLESDVVNNGEIINQKKLSEALKRTLESTKPNSLNVPEYTIKDKKHKFAKKEHKAIISLPESKIYTQVFKFENRADLYKKIKDELAKTLPFEKENFYWDFTEVSTREGVKVVCVAVLQDIADSYIHFFKSTNIDPVAFEVEGESIGRALLPLKKISRGKKKRGLFKKKEQEKDEVMADNKSRMIIDLGARSTMIDIFNEEAVLVISVPLPYAGNYFTSKVAESLGISREEANKIKEAEGFKKDGKTYEILKPHGEKIAKEIEDAFRYYEREFNSKVKEIIMAGGTALLPGIVEFFQEKVGKVGVKIGDPLKKINDFGMLDQKEKILYSNVIGLGLRSLKKDPIETGVNLLPKEVRNQARKGQQEAHRSVLLVAVFIVIAGFLLLGLSIYYLIYLPVPAPMQPLKSRILLALEDEKVETIDVVFISDDIEEEIVVYSGPGEDSEVIDYNVSSGEFYIATGQRAGWIRIKIEDREGWINGNDLKAIETMDIKEFEKMKTKEDIGIDTEAE
ncbi:MAG: pilus assembly protein PilM, partial [Patescibacteria group bacterium]|nr:pilus assembly protein PilM [Patescibacteria group bacterium]